MRILRPAFLVILTLACLAPRVARADEPQQATESDARERSRAAFRRGVTQLRAQDWTGARASFEAAWALYQHPSILLNLGIARLKTGDPVLAEQDLVRFLSDDAGSSAEELAGAREALAEARTKLGTLRVVISPAIGRVNVDGKPLELVKRGDDLLVGEARTKAGRHAVTAQAEGAATEHRDVEVPAKGGVQIRIALRPHGTPGAGQADRGTPTRVVVGWSAVGLAGAALVTGGVLALRAKALADAYNDRSSGQFQDPSTRSQGVTLRTGADIALGVAIVSGVAAAVLLFTGVGGTVPADRRGALLRW